MFCVLYALIHIEHHQQKTWKHLNKSILLYESSFLVISN